MISRLRRRLASCALALVVCQAALVFAAPLASCCPVRSRATAAEAEKDCCPAGSHAPGQCPRHAREKAETKGSRRMQCDAPHGAEFILGFAGLIPSPLASLIVPAASPAVVVAALDPKTRPFVPDSPPPRLG